MSLEKSRSQKIQNYLKCFYLAQYITSQTYSLLILTKLNVFSFLSNRKNGCKTVKSGEGGMFHYYC